MPKYDHSTSGNPYVKAFHDLLSTSRDFIGFLGDPNERQGIRQGLTDAVNRGAVAATLGAPVDMANTALNLGKAAVGYLGNKAGVLSAGQMPQPTEKPFLGSEYIGNQMQRFGMVSPNRNALAEGLAGVLPMSPSTTGKAVAAIGLGGAVPGIESAMFIGPNAKMWNAASARQALQMEQAGVDPREIWAKTGTFRGPEGRLRQEIDDRAAVFNPSGPEGARVSNDIGFNANPDFNYGHPVVKNSLIEHPLLERAYGRSLAKNSYIRNKNTALGDGPLGEFNPGKESLTIYAPAKAEDARSTALHELQHAVQTREGFARGGNAGEFANSRQMVDEWSKTAEQIDVAHELRQMMNSGMSLGEARTAYQAKTGVYPDSDAALFAKDYSLPQLAVEKANAVKKVNEHADAAIVGPHGMYQRLAGEAEARATQARRDMTPEQRLATFPYESYDVPRDQLIVKTDLGGGSQMALPAQGRSGFGAFDPRYDPRVKEQGRLNALTRDVQLNPGAQNAPTVSLADFEGRPFLTSMADRTAAGGKLTGVEGVQFNRPVELQGGQDFMFNNPGQVWASAQGPVNQLMRQAKEIKAATGQDPLYLPWRMAPTGGDFASMTGETMLAYADAAMNKRTKRSLDKSIKEWIPEWKGVANPESVEQFRKAPDKARKAIKNMMDTNFRNEGGLNIGGARLAVSDPAQLAAQEGGIQNVGEIFAGQPIIRESGHFAYPRGIPGQGVGTLSEDLNIFQLLPEAAQARGIPSAMNPRTTDIRALQMKPYAGVLSNQLLKRLGY